MPGTNLGRAEAVQEWGRDMEENLYITDLVDFEILQRMQDVFAKMTGVEALTTDKNGSPVTKGGCDFCSKFMMASEEGRILCKECHLQGAYLAMQEGTPVVRTCHAGLLTITAPIMENDEQMVGCFIAGQVLMEKPDDAMAEKIVEEIGADFEECKELLGRVRIVSM